MRVACVWFERSTDVSKFAELFLRFSPQICLRPDRAIFIEVGACRGLYSEESFLARARVLLRKQGLKAQIAIGASIPHAAALASFGFSNVDDLPLDALLEMTDPFDRDEVVRKGILTLISSFFDLGVKNIGSFRKIPQAELISRFGILGRFSHQRVNNQDFIAWPHWQPQEIVSEKKEFPYLEFYGELEPILFELKNQLDQIYMRLRSRHQRATKIQVEITCEKNSFHLNNIRTLIFDFFSPQSTTKGTLRVLKERLTREFEKSPIKSPIESIETKILKLAAGVSGQKNIFNNDEEKYEELNSLHSQLVEILGRENVFQATLTEDRRPEKSWVKTFGAPHIRSESEVKLTDRIAERPTYFLKKPVQIQVTAGFIHIQKKRYRILHWDNNIERISGGWFEVASPELRSSFDRNYYHVELEGRRRITVFETPHREFFLHGYYG